MNPWRRFSRWLATPVDGGSLAAMRFFVGLITALEAYSLLRGRVGTTMLEAAYTGAQVRYHFSYPGLDWIEPLPDRAMNVIVLLMGVAGLSLAVGFVYRAAVVVAFVLRTYVFLLDVSQYNNHYYLECLLLLLLCVTPADRCWSLDARWKSRQQGTGANDSRLVPYWSVFLFQAQVFILYFYGGLTKLNEPYLFAAQPMRAVIGAPEVLAPFQSYLLPETISWLRGWLAWPPTAYLLSYSGLAYDLTVGFLLIVRRTRFLGLALTVAFHALNHFVFFDDIGWFPLLGVLSTLIFFAPDWPTRFVHVLDRPKWPRPDWIWLVAGAVGIPVIGAALGWQPKPYGFKPIEGVPARRWPVAAFVSVWIAFQCLWPLRHMAIAGPVIWTQEGALFSWRMKQSLRLSEFPRFRVDDPALQTIGPDGKTEIEWYALPSDPNSRVEFQDIDPDAIDWRKLPEVIVAYVPLYGECILVNPYAGRPDEPLSFDATMTRAKDLWSRAFNRPLADGSMMPTDPPEVVLAFVERALDAKAAPAQLMEQARLALQLFEALRRTAPDRPERQSLYDNYRTALRNLVSHPQHGRLVSELLARAHPLSLWGAVNPEVPFVRVVDFSLLRDSGDGFVRVDHAALRPMLLDVQTVYLPRPQLYSVDWAALPRVIVIRDKTGDASFMWNPYAELSEWQASAMVRSPLMLYDYAVHIADEWETEYRQRPAVYVESRAALPPETWRLCIDPDVDLAKAPRYFLRHNPWVTLPDEGVPQESTAGDSSASAETR